MNKSKIFSWMAYILQILCFLMGFVAFSTVGRNSSDTMLNFFTYAVLTCMVLQLPIILFLILGIFMNGRKKSRTIFNLILIVLVLGILIFSISYINNPL